jgi:hypothetical protein
MACLQRKTRRWASSFTVVGARRQAAWARTKHTAVHTQKAQHTQKERDGVSQRSFLAISPQITDPGDHHT